MAFLPDPCDTWITLGAPFLAAAYMVVDYDRNLLHLAKPWRLGNSSSSFNDKTSYEPKAPSTVRLLPDYCNKNSLELFGGTRGYRPPHESPPVPLLVGPVMGGLAAIALLLGGIYWVRVRKKRLAGKIEGAEDEVPAGTEVGAGYARGVNVPQEELVVNVPEEGGGLLRDWNANG